MGLSILERQAERRGAAMGGLVRPSHPSLWALRTLFASARPLTQDGVENA